MQHNSVSSKDFFPKNFFTIFLICAPVIVLVSCLISTPSLYFKSLIYTILNIYALIVLSFSYVKTAIFLSLSTVTFTLFSNVGIQKEITYLYTAQCIFIFLFVLSYYMKNINLKANIKKINKRINIDYVTGLYNKRYFDEMILTEYSPSTTQTCMVSVSISDFNNIILNYGYSTSEILLKDVGKIIKRKLGKDNLCFRIDGENFVVITKNIKDSDLKKECRECKFLIENKTFNINNKILSIYVNMSTSSSILFRNHLDYLDSTIKMLNSSSTDSFGIHHISDVAVAKK